MEEAKVVVVVEREWCRASSRLGSARVVAGEPHVLAHFPERDFAKLAAALAENGYDFEVKVEHREVSMLEWYGMQGAADG